MKVKIMFEGNQIGKGILDISTKHKSEHPQLGQVETAWLKNVIFNKDAIGKNETLASFDILSLEDKIIMRSAWFEYIKYDIDVVPLGAEGILLCRLLESK